MTDTKVAKKYLNDIRSIEAEINTKQELADTLRSQALSIQASSLKDMNVQESLRQTTQDRIAKYMDMQQDINTMVDELVDEKRAVIKQINQLDEGIHRTILIRRYVMEQEWTCIAKAIGYEERQTLRFHGTALNAFGKLLSVNVLDCR